MIEPSIRLRRTVTPTKLPVAPKGRFETNTLRRSSMLNRRLVRGRTLLAKFVHDPGFRANPVRALVRLLVWRTRCWAHRPAAYAWPGHEQYRFVLPCVWTSETIVRYVFRRVSPQDHELSWLARRLAPDSVIMDIGANLGQWTLPLALAVAPAGRVLAIEPAAATFAALRQSLALNHMSHVEAFGVALADSEGSLRLYHHGRDSSQHSLAALGGQFETVRALTLDQFMSEHSITRLDAVKMDVEGAEELVLRGATRTLATFRPIVVFELVPGFAERLGLTSDGPIQLLRGMGYQIIELDEDGGERPIDDLDLSRHPVGWNVIALHIDRRGEYSAHA